MKKKKKEKKKEDCHLQGDCQATSVIYKCDVTAPNQAKKVYIGLTEKELKQRISGHKTSIKNAKYRHYTTLSTYVWNLKDQNIVPTLNWSIMKQLRAYSNKN